MLRVNTLTGFGGGGGGGIVIAGSVLGNVNTTNTTTHALGNIDVGPSSSDKNIILGITWSDDDPRTISSVTVGGVSLAEKVAVALVATEDLAAAIWTGDISSISGSQAISVTFSGNVQSSGVSGVAVSVLQSLTPTMTDTDTVVGTSTATLTALAAPGGGITFACAIGDSRLNSASWTTLTERADLQTAADAEDHRHTAAWDLGARSAADATVDFTVGDTAAAGAGFR